MDVVLNFFKRQSRNLFPGYFAMVMATGALSLSCWYIGLTLIAEILIYFNIVIYVVLLALNIMRVSLNTSEFMEDLSDHSKGPGFFTLIAGTEVLGSQLVVIKGLYTVGLIFWVAAFLLWIILMYAFFTFVIVKKIKPAIEEAVNGGWLLAVVSTQSISVLGTLISPSTGEFSEIVLFISLCHFLLGCMLYLNIISVIFYRLMFLKVEVMSLAPPYWINMGAIAITTLAGSMLMIYGTEFSLVEELMVFIKGFTLFYWVLGTWWIPLLVSLGIWRHILNHYPLTYDPQMWGMAFPIAMYTVGTTKLSMALDFEFLMIIPYITIFAAIGVWLSILVGMVIKLRKRQFGRG
ncbi:tellurite resistance/C4-dicarboxylate transporter family protein [Salinicoccus sp. HZC-1]|uniref:tellurite resistance/C4-dicarboxylate transporter family protein n=1 Tax=Salinicoccus sp. HZC-1 TaxID=3385497 RepID=UPI00398B5161